MPSLEMKPFLTTSHTFRIVRPQRIPPWKVCFVPWKGLFCKSGHMMGSNFILFEMTQIFGEAQSSDRPWAGCETKARRTSYSCIRARTESPLSTHPLSVTHLLSRRGHGEIRQCFRVAWVESSRSWAYAYPLTGGCEQTYTDRATNTVMYRKPQGRHSS